MGEIVGFNSHSDGLAQWLARFRDSGVDRAQG